MRKPFLWLWAVWLLVGTAFEVWGVWFHMQGDDTLSEFTVWAFRASTTVGWFALMLLMGFLAAWFPGHVRHLAQMKKASEAARKARRPKPFAAPTSFYEQPVTKAPRSVPPEEQHRVQGPYSL